MQGPAYIAYMVVNQIREFTPATLGTELETYVFNLSSEGVSIIHCSRPSVANSYHFVFLLIHSPFNRKFYKIQNVFQHFATSFTVFFLPYCGPR